MKTLWLLRHAKSSWADASLSDHDRPLKPRGIRAARKMGTILADQTPFPELVCCSTALRARATWELAAETISPQRSLPPVHYHAELYHASGQQLQTFTAAVPSDHTVVLLVGHNPGFEELVSAVTGRKTEIPTAALLCLECDSPDWAAFQHSRAVRLRQIWRPRDTE